MTSFILSQIFGGIALILVCISYFLSKKSFLFVQIIANVFYGGAFIASLSLVGGINTFVSIIRCVILYYYEKKDKAVPLYYLFIFGAIYLGVGIVFFDGYWDIITMFSPIMFTFAMMMKRMIMVKWFMLFPNLALTFFCVFNEFYTSAILDFIEFSVILVAILTYYIQKRQNVDNSYKIIRAIAFDKEI